MGKSNEIIAPPPHSGWQCAQLDVCGGGGGEVAATELGPALNYHVG